MHSSKSKEWPHLLIALLGLLIISLALLLPACSQSQKGTPAPPFELTNQFGETTTLSQLKGKVVVLTFLYTHCPEVCPLYVFKIQQAMTRLGTPTPQEVTLLAITVDPERDTVERLRQYTANLSPNWLFLTGEPGPLKVAWDDYGIYVERQAESMAMGGEGHAEHQGYELIHTAKVVLIDEEGLIRSELTGVDWQIEELEEKVGRLLAGQEIKADFRPWQSFVGFLYRCGPISFSSLGGAIGHFIFLLSIPAILYGLYRLLAR